MFGPEFRGNQPFQFLLTLYLIPNGIAGTILSEKIYSQKKGGDLNDEGGINRQRGEGSENLESVIRKSHQCIYQYGDEGVKEGG